MKADAFQDPHMIVARTPLIKSTAVTGYWEKPDDIKVLYTVRIMAFFQEKSAAVKARGESVYS